MKLCSVYERVEKPNIGKSTIYIVEKSLQIVINKGLPRFSGERLKVDILLAKLGFQV